MLNTTSASRFESCVPQNNQFLPQQQNFSVMNNTLGQPYPIMNAYSQQNLNPNAQQSQVIKQIKKLN